MLSFCPCLVLIIYPLSYHEPCCWLLSFVPWSLLEEAGGGWRVGPTVPWDSNCSSFLLFICVSCCFMSLFFPMSTVGEAGVWKWEVHQCPGTLRDFSMSSLLHYTFVLWLPSSFRGLVLLVILLLVVIPVDCASSVVVVVIVGVVRVSVLVLLLCLVLVLVIVLSSYCHRCVLLLSSLCLFIVVVSCSWGSCCHLRVFFLSSSWWFVLQSVVLPHYWKFAPVEIVPKSTGSHPHAESSYPAVLLSS